VKSKIIKVTSPLIGYMGSVSIRASPLIALTGIVATPARLTSRKK
jgi:hypothetical protein